jgi:hypothetical protein
MELFFVAGVQALGPHNANVCPLRPRAAIKSGRLCNIFGSCTYTYSYTVTLVLSVPGGIKGRVG